MVVKKARHCLNLESGKFLLGTNPKESDFILTDEGSLEKIVKRVCSTNYDVLIETSKGSVYSCDQVVEYARKLP